MATIDRNVDLFSRQRLGKWTRFSHLSNFWYFSKELCKENPKSAISLLDVWLHTLLVRARTGPPSRTLIPNPSASAAVAPACVGRSGGVWPTHSLQLAPGHHWLAPAPLTGRSKRTHMPALRVVAPTWHMAMYFYATKISAIVCATRCKRTVLQQSRGQRDRDKHKCRHGKRNRRRSRCTQGNSDSDDDCCCCGRDDETSHQPDVGIFMLNTSSNTNAGAGISTEFQLGNEEMLIQRRHSAEQLSALGLELGFQNLNVSWVANQMVYSLLIYRIQIFVSLCSSALSTMPSNMMCPEIRTNLARAKPNSR